MNFSQTIILFSPSELALLPLFGQDHRQPPRFATAKDAGENPTEFIQGNLLAKSDVSIYLFLVAPKL
jgi:hypothetical protein